MSPGPSLARPRGGCSPRGAGRRTGRSLATFPSFFPPGQATAGDQTQGRLPAWAPAGGGVRGGATGVGHTGKHKPRGDGAVGRKGAAGALPSAPARSEGSLRVPKGAAAARTPASECTCVRAATRGLAHPSAGARLSPLSEQTRRAVPADLFLLLCLPFFGFDSFRCPGGALACCRLLGGGAAATALLLREGREGRGLECWLLCSAGAGGRRGGGGGR